MTDPAIVMSRLVQIEGEMAELQNNWATAAEGHARLDRQWKRRLAEALKNAPGENIKTREANALLAAVAVDDLHDRLGQVEEALAKAKTLFSVLERRASIGQSILRAQNTDGFRQTSGPNR